MLKALRRFTDARSVEGKIVAVVLVIALAFMAWDVNALRYAMADDEAAVAAQSEAKEKAAEDEAVKAAAEKAAAEKAEREAAAKAEREAAAKAEREAAEKAEREAAEKAEREAAVKAEQEAAEKAAAEREAAEKAEREAAAKAEREAAEKEAAERAAAEQKAAERESAEPEGDSSTSAATPPSLGETDEPEPAATETEPEAEPEKASETESEKTKETEKAAYPAVVLYGKANGVTVKLSAPEGALPEGVQLRVKDVTSEQLANQVEKATNQKLSDYRAIDITIVDKNNKEVQPKKAVNVTFVGADMDDGAVSVYHVEGGSVDRVSTSQADANTQSFSARGFSVYFIAVVPTVEDTGEHYTVTFVTESDEGDQVIVDQLFDVDAGQTVGTLPEAPFKPGSHFVKWVDRATGAQVTADTVVNGDITAVAQFDEVKVYQVTVEHWYTNPNNGEDTVFNTTIVEMERSDAPLSIESPVSTTVETDDGTTQPTYIPTQSSVEITLDDLANAEVRDGKGYLLKRVEFVPYDTTFYYVHKLANLDGNGYTTVKREEAKGVMGSSVTAPRREVTGGVFNHAETATITRDGQEVAAYYDRATYKVTFDVNGGNYVDAQVVPYGSQVSLPTPTRTGYTFAGWYADEDLTDRVTGSVTVTAPVTLYAKWTAGKANYTIVYLMEKYDNATGTTSYVYKSTKTAQATVGSTVQASSAAKLSGMNGYELDTARNAESSVKVAADGSSVLRVYYKLIRYTLVFNINRTNGRIAMGGSTYSGSNYKIENVVLGQDVSSMWPSSSNEIYDTSSGWNKGYFSGWTGAGSTYITKRYELIWDNVSKANSNHVMTFKASWSDSSASRNAEYWLQQPDGTYQVEDDYTQIGLNTTNLGAKDIDGYTKHSGTPAGYTGSGTSNGVYTYRFYYDRNSFSIDYYYGGTKLTTKSNILFGTDISGPDYNYTPDVPTGLADATWGGWRADSSLETPYNFTTMPGNNLALYAKWVLPDRTITFVDEASGADPQTETYEHGRAAESITPAKRPGYTFQGWYTDAACTQLYDFDKPLTSDVTVYAKWTQDVLSYTVRYVDAADNTVDVLPAKTVSGPALQLGSTITERAAVVAGMLPDEGTKSIELGLTGNEIVFTYTKKKAVITYDVKYVLASDESIEVAPARTGVEVSGDIVSVKEAAAPVDYDLLASQGITGEVFHPESEVVDYTFSTGANLILFKYVSYQSASFTVNYLDMDGNPIPGVETQTATAKVGGGFTVPTGLAGYTLDHIQKNGVDQGTRTYYVAQDGKAVTIDVFYRTKITVTANNKSKVYDGTPLVSSGVGDATVTGLQTGHTLAAIDYDGSQTQAGSSATTPKNARITGPANARYYDIEYIAGNLTVTKPSVVVTIAGDTVEATYDGQPHTAGYTVTNISNPDFKAEYLQFNGQAATVELTHAGTRTLQLDGMFGVVPAQANNFDVTFVITNGQVTVNPAPLAITTNSAKRVYDGTPLTASGATVNGLVNGETLPVTATGSRTDAGTAANTATPDWTSATAQQGDYEITLTEGTLEVTPATLTVVAKPQAYIYDGSAKGEAGTAYTDATVVGGKVMVTGLAATDSLTGITLTGQKTKVGVYEGAIEPSDAVIALGHTADAGSPAASDPLANYTVTYNPGTLTITENATDLTLSAESGGGVYNGLPYGLLNVKASLDDATIEYKVGDGEWSTTAPTATAVVDSQNGTISVRATLEGYTAAQIDNLSIVVTPKPVTVTAQPAGKTFGAEEPELTATVDGVFEGDTIAYELSRAEGEDVGSYVITASGEATQGNYAVTYVPATFTITPAAVTVRAQDATKVYGEDDPALTAQVEGVLDGDTVSYTLSRTPGENVGSYSIIASGATVQGNYTVTFVPATFDITRAAVTVTGDNATKVYGESDPVFTATVEGLVNGDDASVIEYRITRAPGEDVGEYAITPTGAAEQGNYTVTYAAGLLDITRATVIVTADDAGKVYGEADPDEFGAAISGLRNGDTSEAIAFTVSREAGEDAGTYAITPAGEATQGNYEVVYADGTFTITKAQVVVKAQDAGKVYGAEDPALTATVTGLVGTDTINYTVTRVEGEHAGTYTITAAGDASQGNYDIRYEGAVFTISKAPLQVSVADAEKVYGDPDPAYTVTVNGLQRNDSQAMITYTLTREPGEDVGTYTLALDGASVQGDYEISYIPATLTITPAAVTVKVDDATKAYGDADPSFTATVDGLKRGDAASSISYTTSRAPGEDVGEYAITATGRATQGNYTVTFEPGSFTITPVELTVTAVNTGKVYGEEDPALTATVTGLRNGDEASVVTYEVTRAPGEDVGDYEITVNGESDQGNYLVTYKNGTFTITPAGTLQVSGQTLSAEYSGEAIGAAAVPTVTTGTTVEYSTDDGKTWSTDVPTRTDVGTTTVQVRATNANYDTATGEYTLTVTPKAVIVKAVDTGKVYGEDDPTHYEFTVSGLVAGESEDLISVEGVNRDAGENVGEYAITATGEATQGNYAVTFEPGVFTISAKGVTVTGADASKVYGTLDPAFTATVEGLVGDDTIDYTVSRSQGEDVGTYAVIPNGAATQGNYMVTYVTGHFTITKAAVTVTAQPATKVYGDDDPDFTAVVDGLVGNDSVAYTISREEGEDVGDYAITPAGDTAQGNYDVTFVPANFAITPAKVIVSADDKTQVYGGNAQALTAQVKGLKRGDTEDDIAYDLSRVDGTNVGDYDITPTGEATQGNYQVAFERGVYHIVPAMVTVAARDAGKTYGQEDPALEATVTGLLFNDSISYRVTRAAGEDVGEYAITAAGDTTQGNYTVLYVPATFTISKAKLTVTADDKTQVYGDAAQPLTATVTGLAGEDAEGVVGYTLTRAAGDNVGTYTITPALAAEPHNYTVELVTGTYAITPATVTVAAVDASKVYGEADPELTATVSGLKNGDAESLIAYTVSRAAGENAGAYALTAAGAANQGNYQVKYVPGTFTITRALATVTADAKAKEYGQPDPPLTATVSGLVAGDTASVISYVLAREAGEDAGSYDITATGEAIQGNYDVVFEGSALTIARSGELAVAGTSLEVTFDGNPHGTAAQPSVVTGTTVEYSVDGGATWSTDVPTRTDVGTITVQVRATNANYEDATNSYTITVNPKAVTVAAVDASKTYGEEDPELTATVTGLVGDDAVAYEVTREAGENVGDYAITPSGEAVQGNYTVTYEPATFTINRSGALAVFAMDAEATYDGQRHEISAAIVTVTEGTTVLYRLGDADEWSEELPGAIDAGVYSVQVRATNPNYQDAQATCTLTINRAVATVTADAASKVYGDEDPALTAQVSGVVAGDAAIAYTVTRTPGENVGEYAITPAGAATQGNYDVTYVPAVFTITQAPLVVTVADAAKVYGDEDPAFAATVTGLKRGDAESVVRYDISRATGEDVGDYVISAVGAPEQGNYAITYETGTFTITRAPAIVTAVSASKTFGDPDPVLTATVSGLKNGDTDAVIAYNVARDPGENVGEYEIAASGDAVQGNYDVTYAPGTFVIGRAGTLVVTGTDLEGIYTGTPYGVPAAASVIADTTVEYRVNGGAWTAVAPTRTNVGTTTVHVRAINPNYDTATATYTITVTPATATVTAIDAGKVYGDPDPAALRYEVSGLVAGEPDSLIAVDSVTRAAGQDVGTYRIKPAGAAEQGNYVVEYENGTFTITPKTVVVAARPDSKVYGEDDPAFRADVTGLVAGDDADLIAYYVAREPGEDAGSYAITPTGAAEQGNYAVSYEPAAFTITRAELTVTADDKTQVYGAAETPLSATVTGLVNGDAASVVAYALSRADGSDVGTYAITPSGDAVQGNYTVTYLPGEYAITPAPVTVFAQNAAKAYGQPDPTLTAVVQGLVAGDAESLISYALSRAEGEDVGEYAITATGEAAQGNYAVSYEPAVLTIVRSGELAVVGTDVRATYTGEPISAAAATASAPGSTIEYRLGDEGEWTTEVPSATAAGTYTVHARATNSNYEPAETEYTLVIDPAPVTVVAADATKVYGEADPAFEAQVLGLVGGDEPGVISYELARAAGEDVGTYAITPSGKAAQGNYRVTFDAGLFVITPAPLTVTAADAAKVYGDADPDFAATVSGLRNGDSAEVVTYELARAAGEDVGAYAITPSGNAIQGNYSIMYVPAELAITRAQATVTAVSAAKTYGEPDPELTATVSGLKNGDGPEVIAYNVVRDPGENVGEYAITASGIATQGNYDVTYAPGTFAIGRAGTLVVTGTDISGVYNGDPYGVPAAVNVADGTTVEYRVNGGEWTTEVPTRTDVGETTVEVRVSNPNYEPVTGTYTIVVTPATATVTALDATKVYGEANPSEYGYQVSGLVDGETADLIAVDSVSRAAGEDVGAYTITPAGKATQGNYTVEFRGGTFTITPKAVTVTAQANSKTYGEADPALSANVSGLVDGEQADLIAYNVAREAGEDVGTYAITPAGAKTQGNYTVSYEAADFTITRATLTVTADDKTQVYGAAQTPLTATITGLVNGDAASVVAYALSRATGSDVGTYAITPSGDAAQGNYTVRYRAGEYAITPAPVTVFAQNAAKAYGEPDPALTAQVTGLVAGDAEDVISYALSRAEGEDVGEYAITATGEAAQGNYAVSFEPATFTIVRSGELAVAGTDVRATYTGEPISAAPATASAPGSTIEYRLDDADEWSSEVPSATAAGTYTVHARATNSNYEPAETEYTLVIDPAAVTVTAVGAAKVYGEDDPAFTAQVTGLVGGDAEDVISFTVARESGEDVGTYAITPSGEAAQGNYAVTYAAAAFDITPAAITVTAADATKVYGEADPEFTATVDGLVGEDAPELISYAVARSDAGDDTVGAHATITPSGEAVQGNYAVTYLPGTLTITHATVTVTAQAASKFYGEPDPTFTAQVDGLVGEDTADAITYTMTRTTGENVVVAGEGMTTQDEYQVLVLGDAIQGNYRITFEPAAFTIEPRPVEVTSASATKVFDGEPLSAASATQTGGLGFLAGEEPGYLFTGEQTFVGESENAFEVDPASTTRLSNYAITLVPGTLSVTDAGTDPSKVVQKTHADTSYVVGETVTFTVKATNIYNTAKTITFEELPGVELEQAEFADVAPGASVQTTARYTVTAEDVAAGSFKNTVTARFNGVDDPYEGDDTVKIVEQRLDVSKVILNPQERYRVGDEVLYLITVRNAGTTTLKNVTVEDRLGNGGRVAITSAGDGVIDGQRVTYAELAAGDTRTITASYTTREADAGKRITNAVVATVPSDPDAGDTDTVESNPVTGAYNLVIHYVYENGATAAPDYTARLYAGDAFDVDSPSVAGYTPDYSRMASGEAGMPERDLELYVVYRSNTTPTPAVVPTPTPTPTPDPGTTPEPGTNGRPGPSATPTPATPTPTPPQATPPRAPIVPPSGIVNIGEDGNPLVEAVGEDTTPLASVDGFWSLLDLLATIVMVLVGLVLAIGLFGRKRKGDEDEEEDEEAKQADEATQAQAAPAASDEAAAAAEVEEEEEEEEPQVVKRRRIRRVVAIILAIAAVILLLWTQDFTLPMELIDQWTIVFAIMLIIQLIVAFLSRKKKEDDEAEEEEEAPAEEETTGMPATAGA